MLSKYSLSKHVKTRAYFGQGKTEMDGSWTDCIIEILLDRYTLTFTLPCHVSLTLGHRHFKFEQLIASNHLQIGRGNVKDIFVQRIQHCRLRYFPTDQEIDRMMSY